jgi:hypothetical protein
MAFCSRRAPDSESPVPEQEAPAPRFLFMRFVVKRAHKGWMVWDEETRTVAVVDHYRAIDLSAETAHRFAEKLNRLHQDLTHLTRVRV